MFDLSGKRAVIAGGAAGIGIAAARALAGAGAEVVLVDGAEPIMQLGPADQAFPGFPCNVSDEADIIATLQNVMSKHGDIDILVNAAVRNHNASLSEITGQEWDLVQATNLKAAFLFTRELVPSMQRRGGGRIINISTIGSVHPVLNGNAAYSASRAGLNQLTRNCALDLASQAITANAILPGAIITGTIASDFRPTGPGSNPDRHLSGYGEPDDISGLIVLLASPAGRYITGQSIAVDGGFLVS